MSDPAPRRRLPRFSLFTLIVVVNVAGVLVWANVVQRRQAADEFRYHPIRVGYYYGWPYPAYAYVLRLDFSFRDQPPSHMQWFFTGVLFNLAIALGLLLVSGLFTEFLVRKFRKAKRHDG